MSQEVVMSFLRFRRGRGALACGIDAGVRTDAPRLPGGAHIPGPRGRLQGRRAEGQYSARRPEGRDWPASAPTPFGFGGWVALTKGTTGMDVMMGDLVLTEDEVNPVMSALLENGLEVTALHNHFFWEQPRIFYMHVHGMGTPADLAERLQPALALIPKPPAAAAPAPAPAARRHRHRRAGEDRRSGGGTERSGLQDHDRAARHRSPRSRRRRSTRAWA